MKIYLTIPLAGITDTFLKKASALVLFLRQDLAGVQVVHQPFETSELDNTYPIDGPLIKEQSDADLMILLADRIITSRCSKEVLNRLQLRRPLLIGIVRDNNYQLAQVHEKLEFIGYPVQDNRTIIFFTFYTDVIEIVDRAEQLLKMLSKPKTRYVRAVA